MLNCLTASQAIEEGILLANKGLTQTARPAKQTWHALRAAGSQTIVPLLLHAHRHTDTYERTHKRTTFIISLLSSGAPQLRIGFAARLGSLFILDIIKGQ